MHSQNFTSCNTAACSFSHFLKVFILVDDDSLFFSGEISQNCKNCFGAHAAQNYLAVKTASRIAPLTESGSLERRGHTLSHSHWEECPPPPRLPLACNVTLKSQQWSPDRWWMYSKKSHSSAGGRGGRIIAPRTDHPPPFTTVNSCNLSQLSSHLSRETKSLHQCCDAETRCFYSWETWGCAALRLNTGDAGGHV